MQNEIIKQAFKLGNSAGVILPIEWKDKKVVIKLIDKSIQQEIIEILDERDLLKNKIEKAIIKNLYLVSLINEAKVILNNDFLKYYKDKTSKILIKKHLDEI